MLPYAFFMVTSSPPQICNNQQLAPFPIFGEVLADALIPFIAFWKLPSPYEKGSSHVNGLHECALHALLFLS